MVDLILDQLEKAEQVETGCCSGDQNKCSQQASWAIIIEPPNRFGTGKAPKVSPCVTNSRETYGSQKRFQVDQFIQMEYSRWFSWYAGINSIHLSSPFHRDCQHHWPLRSPISTERLASTSDAIIANAVAAVVFTSPSRLQAGLKCLAWHGIAGIPHMGDWYSCDRHILETWRPKNMLPLRFLGFLHFWGQLLADCQIDAQNTYLHHRPCTFVICVNRPVGEWKRVLLLAFESFVLQAMRIPNCSSSHGIDLGLPNVNGHCCWCLPSTAGSNGFLGAGSNSEPFLLLCCCSWGALNMSGTAKLKVSTKWLSEHHIFCIPGSETETASPSATTIFLLQNMFAIVWTWT